MSQTDLSDRDSVALIEDYWGALSRERFIDYRRFMRYPNLIEGWFVRDLATHLQQFFVDYKAGNRPTLIIQAPPQHGKSLAVTDFITWAIGTDPTLKIIYASVSERLGIRANREVQRAFHSEKYSSVFPGLLSGATVGIKRDSAPLMNSSAIEFSNGDANHPGSFRNTTIGGLIIGESLDLCIIDDPVKSHEAALSATIREKTWNWFMADAKTRFSDQAALLIVLTRWHVDDMVGRLLDQKNINRDHLKVLSYECIAEDDYKYRKRGEVLFPEFKTPEFIQERKNSFHPRIWNALYQQRPTIEGGNIIKPEWFLWYKELPPLKWIFLTIDTAQKTSNQNDYSVFQCWGFGTDGKLYLIALQRDRMTAPQLEEAFYRFYSAYNKPKKTDKDAAFLGAYIEDKSSGTGLIQYARIRGYLVHEVPRTKDKITRAYESAPHISQGKVFLSEGVYGVENLVSEAANFPLDKYDDLFDTCMTAIEVMYINRSAAFNLRAAMR